MKEMVKTIKKRMIKVKPVDKDAKDTNSVDKAPKHDSALSILLDGNRPIRDIILDKLKSDFVHPRSKPK
jgi:hypothetical protein